MDTSSRGIFDGERLQILLDCVKVLNVHHVAPDPLFTSNIGDVPTSVLGPCKRDVRSQGAKGDDPRQALPSSQEVLADWVVPSIFKDFTPFGVAQPLTSP